MLLHPTSLPGSRLDDAVFRWLDFMHDAGLTVWQVLPLVIPDRTLSPYRSCSAFAADPALLPENYPLPDDDAIDEFLSSNGSWVEEFALFTLLSERMGHRRWWQWTDNLDRRDHAMSTALSPPERARVRDIVAQQCRIDRRLNEIRREASDRGILLFGDMPIFVALESVDVWAHPEYFLLDDQYRPRYVTGVPPDYFSQTGQRWGNPHFDWQAMAANEFDWWRARIARQFSFFDILRLDHFRALAAVWMIEAECDSAVEGFWQDTPGRDLLERISADQGGLPIVAEDLGYITDDVRALRREFTLPGMAVLQFAFDGSPDNPHRPENISRDCVAYTGTHDNDTCVGWFGSLDAYTRSFVLDVLGRRGAGDIAGVMIDAMLRSAACMAITPLQDFLRLPATARMNTPGVPEGNWRWQFAWEEIGGDLADRIRAAVQASGRLGSA